MVADEPARATFAAEAPSSATNSLILDDADMIRSSIVRHSMAVMNIQNITPASTQGFIDDPPQIYVFFRKNPLNLS
jgi:hypothetical protein